MEDVLATGTRLGRYEIVRRLAMGGMAEIYLARMSGPSGFAKHVVLKRILPDHAANAEFVRMFHNEARYAATLDHPNIAHVYDLGEEQGLHYYTMEYLHGDDCRALVRAAGARRRPIPLEDALAIVIGACNGCHFAHEMVGEDGRPLGLVHRDISPSNVVITYAGAVKIVDFGIAKATALEDKTATGATKGKLSYMAPEQGRSQPVDRRADVYALGVLLYELTTLRRAFVGEVDAQILWAVMTGDYARPSAVMAGYPPALEAIVVRAMAVDREQRHASARELQHALEAFAREAGLSPSSSRLGELLESLVGPRLEPWRTDEGRAPAAQPSPSESVDNMGIDFASTDPAQPADPDPDAFASYVPGRRLEPTPTPMATPRRSPIAGRRPDAEAEPSAARSSVSGERPASGRGPWVLAGLLALGGAAAVAYVLWSSPRKDEPPVVVITEGGSAVVETADAAVDAELAVDAGVAVARAIDASAGKRPLRPVKPAADDPLSQAFKRRTGAVDACFKANPTTLVATPTLAVRFEIDAAGVPTDVQLVPPELTRTPLGACILDIARGARFPAQPEPLVFRIPLGLRTDRGGS